MLLSQVETTNVFQWINLLGYPVAVSVVLYVTIVRLGKWCAPRAEAALQKMYSHLDLVGEKLTSIEGHQASMSQKQHETNERITSIAQDQRVIAAFVQKQVSPSGPT